MIFIDTSGLVALFDARDGNHEAARAGWERVKDAGGAVLLTDQIVAETVTLLRRRAGFKAAQRVGERLLSGALGEIVYVDEALLKRAFKLFEKYSDQDLSLVDCTSFAVMRQRRLTRAFTFDNDFRAVGFEQL